MKRARIIVDDSGSALGVVVRILPNDDTEQTIRTAAIVALMEHGDEYGDRLTLDDAAEKLRAMSHCRTDTFRWIPMPKDCGYDFRIEDADGGSRGSWMGRYWSYP